MINLIVTIFGGLMIIAGFYAMSFGFATPPNIFLFFLGLIMAVAGLFLVIIFSSGIELSGTTAPTTSRSAPRPTPVMKARPKPVKVEKKVSEEEKKKETLETIDRIKPQPRIKKPHKVDRPDTSSKSMKERVEEPLAPPESIGTKEIKPKKKSDIGESSTLPPELEPKKPSETKKPPTESKDKTEKTESTEKPKQAEPETKESEIKPIIKPKPAESEPKEPEVKPIIKPESVEPEKTTKTPEVTRPVEKPKPIPRITRPKPKKKKKESKVDEIVVDHEEKAELAPKVESEQETIPTAEEATTKVDEAEKEATPTADKTKQEATTKADEAEQKEYRKIKPIKTEDIQKPPVPKRPDMEKLRSAQINKEDEYVKKRLERMKESYIQNAKDIESIIDERLDSFKGTLGKLKSESKEPGIIWSFDAGDVQEALMDTISKANDRILMMYPWIRNIDVGVLKKFMDTESCIIVQEASLDDDASVELLKLLQEKDVKIRTMPHVHTIAVVADETSGLIISTDPIYESYEVGVVYKDQKSIEEIERLFEDAWNISQDVDLEIK